MSAASSSPSPSYLAESRATLLNVFYSIPIGIELISTLCRLWAKSSRHGYANIGLDDVVIVIATASAIAVCISGLVYGPPYGLGRHIEALDNHDIEMYMLGNYIFSHFYDVAIGTTKLAVLALYHRVFSTGRAFRYTVYGTAIFVIAWIVVMEVTLGLACRPIHDFWRTRKDGTCIDLLAFTYFTNITNLVTDLWIIAIPIPVILGLQASRGRKLRLVFIFSLGLGTCAISAIRLRYVFGVGSRDFTWHEAPFGILSAWEPCGGILCSNLPIIYSPAVRLIRRIRGKPMTDITGTDTSHPSLRRQSQATWDRIHGSHERSRGSRDKSRDSSVDILEMEHHQSGDGLTFGRRGSNRV